MMKTLIIKCNYNIKSRHDDVSYAPHYLYIVQNVVDVAGNIKCSRKTVHECIEYLRKTVTTVQIQTYYKTC